MHALQHDAIDMMTLYVIINKCMIIYYRYDMNSSQVMSRDHAENEFSINTQIFLKPLPEMMVLL